ncbi:hypothetical protein BH10PSE1_BH10PSE1_18380 [soil metagenome]
MSEDQFGAEIASDVSDIPSTTDAIELALEAERDALADPSPARRLIEVSTALAEEQVALARHDLQHRRLQVTAERMSVLVRGLTALAGVAVAVLFGFLVWDGAHARSVIVEPFSVPPEMAQEGLTGPVVSARMIDTLARMRDETIAPSLPVRYGEEAHEDVRVEIPQTGVSLGELRAFLRSWLGHETRIGGELTRQGDTLALSVRAGTEAGALMTSPAADSDALLQKAAEAIFERMDPERYASWLKQHQRRAEALALLEKLSISGERLARARALAQWANLTDDETERLAHAREALRLDPDLPVAKVAVMQAVGGYGHAQAEADALEDALTAWSGPRAKDYAPWFADLTRNELAANVAERHGDLLASAQSYERAGDPAPDQPVVACRKCAGGALTSAAGAYAGLGDGYNAGRLLAQGARTAKTPPQLTRMNDLYVRAVLAYSIDDYAAAAAIFWPPTGPGLAELFQAPPIAANPAQAQVLAWLGRTPEAEAMVRDLPDDCYDCMTARGMVAAMAGDSPRSEAAYAAAVALAPRLSAAQTSHGLMLVRRGDYLRALDVLKDAGRISPNDPEIMIQRGRALMGLGRAREAARQFEEAVGHAPRLGRLQILWGQALAAEGDLNNARVHWLRARQLTLSPAHQALADRLLAAT